MTVKYTCDLCGKKDKDYMGLYRLSPTKLPDLKNVCEKCGRCLNKIHNQEQKIFRERLTEAWKIAILNLKQGSEYKKAHPTEEIN